MSNRDHKNLINLPLISSALSSAELIELVPDFQDVTQADLSLPFIYWDKPNGDEYLIADMPIAKTTDLTLYTADWQGKKIIIGDNQTSTVVKLNLAENPEVSGSNFLANIELYNQWASGELNEAEINQFVDDPENAFDLAENTGSSASTGPVKNVNDSPLGFLVTTTGDAAEESTLTATASVSSDDDGLPEPLTFTYQWQSSADGVEWSSIEGAKSAEFTPDDAEVKLRLRAVASYEDLMGTVESESSESTAAIQGANDAPEGVVRLTSSSEGRYMDPLLSIPEGSWQRGAYISSLLDGGFILTYHEGSSIYGQKFDSNRTLEGDRFQVTENARNYSYSPLAPVAALPDGGFIIFYISSDLGPWGIFGQEYDANGTPRGYEFLVPYTQTSQFSVNELNAASLNDGGFVVIVENKGFLYGTANMVEFQIDTGLVEGRSVASLSDGGFVVTYSLSDSGRFGIFGRIYDSNGTPEGDPFQVNETGVYRYQQPTSVTSLIDGGFVVTWTGYGSDGIDILGRRYDANGMPAGNEFQVNTSDSSNQLQPSVSSLTNGGFVVIWNHRNRYLAGQKYNANGAPEGEEFGIYTNIAGPDPFVISLTDGGFMVAFQRTSQDVQLYRYSAAEGFLFDANADYIEGVPVQADPSLLSDPDGLGVFSYQWQRSENGGQTWSDIAGATTSTYLLANDDALNLLRAKISYLDDQGFDNVVYSQSSPTIENVNDAPIGFSASISGTAAENETLTASASVSSDGDGLDDPVSFSYQWQRSTDDGLSWSDIAVATSASYTLGDDDASNQVRVSASYTDNHGTEETVSSSAQTVTNVNDAPSGFSASISGIPSENEALTASASVTSDADGLDDSVGFTYQWQSSADNSNWSDISGATSEQFTPDDAEIGSYLRVVASYEDNQGTVETTHSPATEKIIADNDPAVGPVNLMSSIESNLEQGYIGSAVAPDLVVLQNGEIFVLSGRHPNKIYTQKYSENGLLADNSTQQIAEEPALMGGVKSQEYSIASLAEGGFVAVWTTENRDIYVQIFNDEGVAVGQRAYVDIDHYASQKNPEVRGLDNGGFAITWQGQQEDGARAIYGRVFEPNGIPAGDTFKINSFDSNPSYPSIAPLPDSGFVVSWNYNEHLELDSLDVFGQVFDYSGNKINSEFQINTYTNSTQIHSSIAALKDGGFVAIWSSYEDGYLVKGQRFDQLGNLSGSEFMVPYASGEDPQVVGLKNGGFAVVSVSGRRIDLRLFDESSELTSQASIVSNYYQGVGNARIAAAPDGGFVVIWSEGNGNGYFQRFNSDGQKLYNDFNIDPVYAENGIIKANALAISDVDGIEAPLFPWSIQETFDFQWQRSEDNGDNWLNISGATSETYRLSNDDSLNYVRAEISYADGQGFQNTIYSEQVTVQNINDDPTGSVTISGDATEGAELTAVTSTIADEDGLGVINYQWLSDGSAISGATSSSHTLTQSEVGKAISVTVSYTDDHGTEESITAEQTGDVANVNDDPTGSVTISGDTTQGAKLTADTSTLADEDGLGTLFYQWLSNRSPISGAKSSTYTLTQSEVGKAISVTVSYIDFQGTVENIVSNPTTSTVTNVNDAPIGFSASISGTAAENETLTASASVSSDDDGLDDPVSFSYQWQRSTDDGSNWSDIAGATSANYTLGDDDASNQVRVSASYTDNHGTEETVSSSAQTVTNVNDAPSGFSASISGIAAENEILTASASVSSDDDGLDDPVSFSYQWQSSSDNSNWSDIAGATSKRFTQDNAEVGSYVRVVASYTDNQGTVESLASSATTSIITNVNDDPTGSVTISGDTTEDAELTAVTIALADEDGLGTLTYQWLSDESAISGATSSTYTLTQSQVGKAISVTVSYTDDHGTEESITSAQTSDVASVNNDPTGSVTISGIAIQGAELTAVTNTLADEDGLGTLTYKWLSDGSAISGATSRTYTLTQSEVGKAISATVSYTDDYGAEESVTSAQTAETASLDPAVDLQVVSRDGNNASLSVFATNDIIPKADGIGSFEFVVSHTLGVLRIDGNSVIGGAGYTVVGNYDENNGKFTVGGFALPNVTDLSLPLATFDLTILDNNIPIELAITDLITDTVSQGPVSKTFDFSGADIDITVLDRNQDELSDVSIQVDVTGTDQEIASYDYSTGASGSVTHSGTDGDSILVTADKLMDEKSEQAIGSFDALQALRLAVGLSKSDGTEDWSDFIAADFNQDGRVGSDDALNILKYAVGLKDGPSSDWVFLDADADWSGIGYRSTDYNEGASVDALTSDTSVNLIGILTGDIDKSFIV